nr:MAG TPA: hypothetical protein [Caudoviricetes sp.]
MCISVCIFRKNNAHAHQNSVIHSIIPNPSNRCCQKKNP